jgi:hypothetical protein
MVLSYFPSGDSVRIPACAGVGGCMQPRYAESATHPSEKPLRGKERAVLEKEKRNQMQHNASTSLAEAADIRSPILFSFPLRSISASL